MRRIDLGNGPVNGRTLLKQVTMTFPTGLPFITADFAKEHHSSSWIFVPLACFRKSSSWLISFVTFSSKHDSSTPLNYILVLFKYGTPHTEVIYVFLTLMYCRPSKELIVVRRIDEQLQGSTLWHRLNWNSIGIKDHFGLFKNAFTILTMASSNSGNN